MGAVDRELREHRQLAMLLAAGPLVGMLLALLFAGAGAERLFQVDLVGLVLMAGLTALGVRRRRILLLAPIAGALLCALLHLLLGGGAAGALAFLWLLLATAAAATGLAAAGRGVGLPGLTAGGLAACALWTAMMGLFWADALGERLPLEQRYAFKEAVMDLDLATACAYGAAHFDRFHEPTVYRDLPIASSIVGAPAPGPTGLLWFVVGCLAWGLALLRKVDRVPPAAAVP